MAFDEVIAENAVTVIAFTSGSILTLILKSYLDKTREFQSTAKDQLKFVYAPLEMLIRSNFLAYERYFKSNTTKHDQEFIEKNIWYPNNTEIKKILMEHSHLLDSFSDTFQKLLTHVNVYLSEYQLVYVKKEKQPPAFAGTKGYPFPKEAEEEIPKIAEELRKKLKRRQFW